MSLLPLHTRTVVLRLFWEDPGHLVCEGRLMDIRKRAIVPLGASLRGPGIVHDMSVSLRVDPETRTVAGVAPAMRAFPYVASEYTGGESCPGRSGDVESIVGLVLDESYSGALRELIGGARGCFHVFTLLRMAGPAVVAALRDGYVENRLAKRQLLTAGEVLWARCVSVDAFQGEGLAVSLHGTLTDTFQRGGPPEAGAGCEELVHGVEVMADLETGFPEMALASIAGRRRNLLPGLGNAEPWEPVAELARFGNLSVRKGFTASVQRIFGDPGTLRPESQLALTMAPVVMQSLPGLLEELQARSGNGGSSTGTALNSCHMWRSDGPLDRLARAGRGR
jgi:hypothetical protein